MKAIMYCDESQPQGHHVFSVCTYIARSVSLWRTSWITSNAAYVCMYYSCQGAPGGSE